MSRTLKLKISTPTGVLVDTGDVRSVGAEDLSGGFGILAGHADFLTVLPPSVVRWRLANGGTHYCAVRAGVLTVSGGHTVSIACRKGVLGDDLDALEAIVHAEREDERDAERRARVEQTHLHARAVRLLMRYLRPDRNGNTLQKARTPTDQAGTGQ